MLRIRPATKNDVPLILDFIHGLAAYERAPEQVVATPELIVEHGFGAQPKFRVVIAEWDGAPAGFALFFYNYSTWRGTPGIFLEDLFVKPEFRGKSIGKALLVHLARIAVDEGCERYVWNVLDWNTPAIEFYESLGAKLLREWLVMRVDGEALKKLAKLTADERG